MYHTLVNAVGRNVKSVLEKHSRTELIVLLAKSVDEDTGRTASTLNVTSEKQQDPFNGVTVTELSQP